MSNYIKTRMELIDMQIKESLMYFSDPLVFIYMNREAAHYLNSECAGIVDCDDMTIFGHKAVVVNDNSHPAFAFTIGERINVLSGQKRD